jgi:hypothetical protein
VRYDGPPEWYPEDEPMTRFEAVVLVAVLTVSFLLVLLCGLVAFHVLGGHGSEFGRIVNHVRPR